MTSSTVYIAILKATKPCLYSVYFQYYSVAKSLRLWELEPIIAGADKHMHGEKEAESLQ